MPSNVSGSMVPAPKPYSESVFKCAMVLNVCAERGGRARADRSEPSTTSQPMRRRVRRVIVRSTESSTVVPYWDRVSRLSRCRRLFPTLRRSMYASALAQLTVKSVIGLYVPVGPVLNRVGSKPSQASG